MQTNIKSSGMPQIKTDELKTSTSKFASALVESKEFVRFDTADVQFHADAQANQALREYQEFARSIQTKRMFNTLTQTEQQELERKWVAFTAFPSVSEYLEAQTEMQALCQACAQVLSDTCHLDFATASGAGGCCG